MFFSINGLAQNENLAFSALNRNKEIPEWRSVNLDLTLGYVPSYQGIKTNFALNNFLLHRLGIYTSLEYGFKIDELVNTVGGTITVHKFIYLWGGIDLFTDKGLISTKSFSIRKELGIGITPYKRSVVLLGWSSSVGLTISAGYRILF